MALEASLGSRDTQDRRSAERRKLRLQTTLEGFRSNALIHELSSTGLLIQTNAGLTIGEAFEVEIPEAGASQATVIWNSGSYFGCEFNLPIPSAAISASLLRGDIFPGQQFVCAPGNSQALDFSARPASYGQAKQRRGAYPPNFRYAFHPFLPERLGFRTILGLTCPDLRRLLSLTDGFSLIGGRDRTTLYREAARVLARGVPGDFIEIGVHRGGSAAILAHLLKREETRKLHLFDRWGDLPEPTSEDGYRQAEYTKANIPEKLTDLRDRPPLQAARELIHGEVGFSKERTRYWQGWYSDTLPTYDGEAIAFASLDCDYYESVRLSLAFLGTRLSPGAVVVVDDYRTWPGTKQAVDEWLTGLNGVSVFAIPTGPLVLRLSNHWSPKI